MFFISRRSSLHTNLFTLYQDKGHIAVYIYFYFKNLLVPNSYFWISYKTCC